MASRRDELNAYTFAKRRLVGQFLQPSPTGTEEGAPKPLRGLMPGVIIGVLILAVFGAVGMFKPKAPDDWEKVGEKIIIASDSTTRYVVLETDGKVQLHPVLNLASAKLLLDPSKGEVVKVDEKILDGGKLPHGASIGIPYAPDRLPEATEAGKQKRWAVCVQPDSNGRAQKAAFVFAEREFGRTEGKERLGGGELLYVQGPGGEDDLYVVDAKGAKYPIDNDQQLLTTVVGDGSEPQKVTADWLDTLKPGQRISFPTIPGAGDAAGVDGLDDDTNRIGTVLRTASGSGHQHYVVLQGQVAPVSDFTAALLLNNPATVSLGQAGEAKDMSVSAFDAGDTYYAGKQDWPKASPDPTDPKRSTVCNILLDGASKDGPKTATWAGSKFPATLPTGSTSAYVTPGSGQLFRQVTGTGTESGFTFLVTDTGLRYALQSNADSAVDESEIGTDGKPKTEKEIQAEAADVQRAQKRLGYDKVAPQPIPEEWSRFLPTGPRLSTEDARQPQGS